MRQPLRDPRGHLVAGLHGVRGDVRAGGACRVTVHISPARREAGERDDRLQPLDRAELRLVGRAGELDVVVVGDRRPVVALPSSAARPGRRRASGRHREDVAGDPGHVERLAGGRAGRGTRTCTGTRSCAGRSRAARRRARSRATRRRRRSSPGRRSRGRPGRRRPCPSGPAGSSRRAAAPGC